jgi:hypothetical protein
LARLLQAELGELRQSATVFAQAEQAEAVIALAFDRLLAAYRKHHGDLLFHQSDDALFTPFFLARCCEAVLDRGGPWDEKQRIIDAALAKLNDFLGHRPLPVLQTQQRIEPYAHERVRPVPLYINGAGVAVGPYQELIESALEILRGTDSDLLDRAGLDPSLLDELAFDPRAYDFDHPVNKRPNYHFGQWDPHHLDLQGRYRRFVLQQVTLDALLDWAAPPPDVPREQRLFEAAAVLAGTMLMAAAISGRSPEAHDSSVTLATLLPRVAADRDEFYARLLDKTQGPHGEWLRGESVRLKQHFASARQHLNQRLARLRALQLQHSHLARLFARMGYPDAAREQADVIRVASARFWCALDCNLTATRQAIDRAELARAEGELLPEAIGLLHRGIECGALPDPWSMLGFQGLYSLFPAMENSVHDHRLDQLLRLMREVFGLFSRLASEAAATGQVDIKKRASQRFRELAEWWDQFASIEVSAVEGISGREAWESSEEVATALAAWRSGGSAAGDVAFWSEHVDRFDSPKAYALVVEALLDKADYVASMALLMHWLSRSEEIDLVIGEFSFHRLSERWMRQVLDQPEAAPGATPPQRRWELARKFFDYLEANAGDEGGIPMPAWAQSAEQAEHDAGDLPEDEDEDDVFSAAYEGVTYRDSTGDGIEGDMLESGQPTDLELDHESRRIGARLALSKTVSRLWKTAAVWTVTTAAELPAQQAGQLRPALESWAVRARENQRRLERLLAAVHARGIPAPSGAQDSLVEYDRRRMVKQALVEQIVATDVETRDAIRVVVSALDEAVDEADSTEWAQAAVKVTRAMLRGDAADAVEALPELVRALRQQPLLYVSLERGGDPQRVVAAQSLQQALRDLLAGLPRLGLLDPTVTLLETAKYMEREHPVGPGAVTEFDRLFAIGYKSLVENLVAAAGDWQSADDAFESGDLESEISNLKSEISDIKSEISNPEWQTPDSSATSADLIDCLRWLAEAFLRRWLEHSRSVRLSILEKVSEDARWRKLQDFVRAYGGDLFSQKFLNLGNLRAILHQGPDAWLRSLEEDPDPPLQFHLLDDLDRGIPRDEAVSLLGTVLEAVVENYGEYLDYNSTTTQSDRGELLYMLLDFLRLKAGYERIAWNLRPVIMAHDILVRRGHIAAAEIWRRAIIERTHEAADRFLKRLAELRGQYGMRLTTIGDLLEERFVRVLAIDRLRALIGPAIEQAREGQPPRAFEALRQEIEEFTQNPTGVGLDLPAWLAQIEEEAQTVLSRPHAGKEGPTARLPRAPLSLAQVQQWLRDLDAPPLRGLP